VEPTRDEVIPSMSAPSAKPSPAVTRAAQVLEALATTENGRSLSLSELARELRCPKSSVANICAALGDARLVARDPASGGFRLGRATLELGGAYLSSFDPVRDFYERVTECEWARRETVQLAAREGTEVTYLARHDGEQPIRIWSTIGGRLPASCTAMGKALLAELSDREVVELYAGSTLPTPTANAAASVEELVTSLEEVREHGYAVDDEEATVGIVCVGVVIPSAGSAAPSLALSSTFLKQRDGEELRHRLLQDLQAIAHALTNPLRTTA
jgi:IclR family transcriptional regulator, blcABC operon repressor